MIFHLVGGKKSFSILFPQSQRNFFNKKLADIDKTVRVENFSFWSFSSAVKEFSASWKKVEERDGPSH